MSLVFLESIGRSTGISAAKVLAAANDFVSLGLKDAGYEYVNIDVVYFPFFRLPSSLHVRIVGRSWNGIQQPMKLYRIRRSFLMASSELQKKSMLWG